MDEYKYIVSRNNYRPSYWHEPADEPYFPFTMGQLIDYAADQWGDDEAFVCVCDNVRFSFKETRQQAFKLAASLLQLGLNSGDTIALWGSTSSHVYLTLLAAATAGLKLAGIERTGNVPELAHRLRKVEAKALVVIELKDDVKKYCEMLHQAIPELWASQPGKLKSGMFPELKIVITHCSEKYTGTFSYNDVLEMGSSSNMESIYKLQTIIQPDDGLIIQSTSGSTGMPKCVLLSQHQIINSAYKNAKQFGVDKQGQRIFTTLQIYGVAAVRFLVVRTFLFGCTVIFGGDNITGESAVNVLQQERCSSFVGVPTPCVDIVKYIKETKLKLSYPEDVTFVGSPVTEKLAADFLKMLPLKCIYIGYSLIESGTVGWSKVTTDMRNVSLFRVLKNIEVKVVNTEGKMVPMGESGELCVRGFTVMKNYLNDSEKSAQCLTSDGWLKTGDICILEENGYIRFISRVKEVIIKRGDNIYPPEIQNFISAHPLVNDVWAFGVPDYRVGEEMCVYIRRDNESLTEEDVQNYCQGELLDDKVPRYVRFVDEFPKIADGKVDRKKLRELFENDKEYVQEKEKHEKLCSE